MIADCHDVEGWAALWAELRQSTPIGIGGRFGLEATAVFAGVRISLLTRKMHNKIGCSRKVGVCETPVVKFASDRGGRCFS